LTVSIRGLLSPPQPVNRIMASGVKYSAIRVAGENNSAGWRLDDHVACVSIHPTRADALETALKKTSKTIALASSNRSSPFRLSIT
jgi:hypothetical protein